MTTSTTTDFIEEKIRKLFDVKNDFYPSGEATTKRFSVGEIRTALKEALAKGVEIEREGILALAGGEPYIYVPKI